MTTRCGLILYRKKDHGPEVFICQENSSTWKWRGESPFTIPKGRVDNEDDDKIKTAIREFEEETGLDFKDIVGSPSTDDLLSLGSVGHKEGHNVFAWAVEGDTPENYTHESNTFEHNGKHLPEIVGWFWVSVPAAKEYIKGYQKPFFDQLLKVI